MIFTESKLTELAKKNRPIEQNIIEKKWKKAERFFFELFIYYCFYSIFLI